MLFHFRLYASDINSAIFFEERVNQDYSSQTVLKLYVSKEYKEDFTLWGFIWLHDQVPFRENSDTQSQYIEFVDIFLGISWNLWDYFEPYLFYDKYYNRSIDYSSSYFAIGFDSILFHQSKHKLHYYFELYSEPKNGNMDYFGGESGLEYSYEIYKHTSLYCLPVWNQDQTHTNIYSFRYGIKVDF